MPVLADITVSLAMVLIDLGMLLKQIQQKSLKDPPQKFTKNKIPPLGKHQNPKSFSKSLYRKVTTPQKESFSIFTISEGRDA